MTTYSNSWRWIALTTTIAGIIYNNIMAAGGKLSIITRQYETLFVPADYAFTIWALIYLSVMVYIIYSLSPRQKAVTAHNGLAKLLTALSLGGILWITSYTSLQLLPSVVFILIMLAAALLSLKSAKILIREKNQPPLLIIPFSLYAAWLTVATISNISLYLKSAEWLANTPQQLWAVLLLLVACVLAIVVTLKYHTVSFTAVIAWATIAIWVRQGNNLAGNAAIIVSIILLAFMIGYYLKRAKWALKTDKK